MFFLLISISSLFPFLYFSISFFLSSFNLSSFTLSSSFTLFVSIGVMCRVFANGPRDWGSIPRRVIPKTQKKGLDATLLNTQQYKVSIRGKVGQSRKWSRTLPYTSVWKLLIKKGTLGSPSTKVTKFAFVFFGGGCNHVLLQYSFKKKMMMSLFLFIFFLFWCFLVVSFDLILLFIHISFFLSFFLSISFSVSIQFLFSLFTSPFFFFFSFLLSLSFLFYFSISISVLNNLQRLIYQSKTNFLQYFIYILFIDCIIGFLLFVCL